MSKFDKFSLIAILVYMVLTFTIPIRRVLYIWQENNTAAFGFAFSYGMYILMGFVLLLTAEVVFHPDRPLTRLINFLTRPRIVSSVTLPFLALCVVLTFTKAPGLWWTWFTVGLHVGSIALIVILLKDKLPSGQAFMLGASFVFLVVGVWEIIYQYGRYYYYDVPQGQGPEVLQGQIRFMTPFVLFGLVMLLLLYRKVRNVLHVNYLTGVFAVLTIAMFAWWFATGLWSDIYLNWQQDKWLYLEPNTLMMEVYRSSKVSIFLTMASFVCAPKKLAALFEMEQTAHK